MEKMSKKRRTMQIATEFDELIKDIQKEIMQKMGMKESTVDITLKLSKRKDSLKKLILDMNGDIKINFDRRER